MPDFLLISTRSTKRGTIEIYPKFVIKKSSDLMIRGGDFYAIWVEELGLWSTDEQDAIQLIDRKLDEYAKENRHKFDSDIKILHMWDAETGMIDAWHKYCQRQMRDSFTMIDEKIIFANTVTTKKDYASKKLSYALEPGDFTAYEQLMSVLYSDTERHKLEWAIGAIISGESKHIQKFVVLYGSPGSGKGTILNIIEALFEGYLSVFDAKALGSSSNSFALESFKTNPLVALQHDGDLSRIEDNTRLNSLVSHEMMTVNEKFKSAYSNRFKSFLFMGTNKPVKITDAKSGLIRRLIDVYPSGEKIIKKEYDILTKQVYFELGAIAHHCLQVFLADPGKYDDYIPINMMSASNDFYNFMFEVYDAFGKEDGITLKAAWEMYKNYCEDTKVAYPHPQRIFKEELKTYFRDYDERYVLADGSRVRSYHRGFKLERIDPTLVKKDNSPIKIYHIELKTNTSALDKYCADCIAQYATNTGTPFKKWDEVTTTLSDIDTSKVHYVQVQGNHIVIDFDIPDENGKKSLERNIEEANKWPATYTEVSKSGKGIHLHYIYTGDVSNLNNLYADHIEVKTPIGKSAIRRKLTKCNTLPIATISSGLPLKGESKMVNFEAVKNEKGLRTLIHKNLNKESHPGTKPSIDFIHKLLDDAYTSGMHYDVSDMYNDILAFALGSTNQSKTCLKIVNDMKFKSEDVVDNIENNKKSIVFYDVEVFPNLFIVCYKIAGKDRQVARLINPKPSEIEELLTYRLIGFNCRRYDNHIMYARMMGYSNEQLYTLSQNIISNQPNCYFGEAYNLSYTDIYDFASAGNKMSLKKWEIKLGIHHQELGLPWDQPVEKSRWNEVADYCVNDVIATEAVFDHLKGDWTARQILADLADMTVNDTTNTLTTRIIFDTNRNPQSQFNYRNMGEVTKDASRVVITKDGTLFTEFGDEYSLFDGQGRPIFPGYKYEFGKSTYRGESIGEGGKVYSKPGIYGNVALLDIASQHPRSMITENLFGDEYTKRFEEVVDARIAIKHGNYDYAKTLLNGKLAKYLDSGEYTPSELADALKTGINSAYGLTAAGFDNPFRDSRNVDNIVAKRGALFMTNLKFEVTARGYTVVHIKTDSIKISDATPNIIQFVMDYGKMYGYSFEHEATYDKICLVNDAVYIAKHATVEKCEKLYGYVPGKNKKNPNKWTATGTQFAVPYTFKKLFSNEEITFDDMCETKAVQTALYLDLNEDLPDVSKEEKEHAKLMKDICNMSLPQDAIMKQKCKRVEELSDIIAKGHNYIFVGRVGQFCPMKDGYGGGILLRETLNKKTGLKGYAAATGSKGYRWLESEMVKELNKVGGIDTSYYDLQVEDAATDISEYASLNWFLGDEPYDKNNNDIYPFN
ncbi:MAG: DUF5906 domain-containing protein [Vallitaleaceae bacterium]|nr:DUF5906 domain-containing protein [Vallitaleaceae bacterium]